MAVRTPLVIGPNGLLQQLQTGDTLAGAAQGPQGVPGPQGPPGPVTNAQGIRLNVDAWARLTLDAAGNFVEGVDRAGVKRTNDQIVGANARLQIVSRAPSLDGFDRQMQDPQGAFAGGFHRHQGPVGKYTNQALTARPYIGDPATFLNWAIDPNVLWFVPIVGQSRACGMNSMPADTPTVVAQSSADPGYAFMFSAGVWPNGRDVSGALAPLVEQVASGSRQTIGWSFAKSVNARLLAATGARPRLLMAAAARTSQPYSTLMRGGASGVYNELLRLYRAAVELGHRQGWRVICPAVLCLQGESDSGIVRRDQRRRDLNQLILAINEDFQAINPQPGAVRLLSDQIEYPALSPGVAPDIALAALDMHSSHPLVRSVGAIYHLPHETGGGPHMTALGYHYLGEQFAEGFLTEICGLPHGGPLHAVESGFSSPAQIAVRFSMPVAIDASGAIVSTAGLVNQGFDFLDASGATPAISSVAAAPGQSDTILVNLVAAASGPRRRLYLACRGSASVAGPVSGPRSTIRSATPFATSSSDGTSLYHWACAQVMELA